MRYRIKMVCLAVVCLTVAAVGCSSSPSQSTDASLFIASKSPTSVVGNVALTSVLVGRIVEVDGCFVLESGGAYRAATFGPGFVFDQESSTVREIRSDGKSVQLGELAKFGGGEISKQSAESDSGVVLPMKCPQDVVRIDKII